MQECGTLAGCQRLNENLNDENSLPFPCNPAIRLMRTRGFPSPPHSGFGFIGIRVAEKMLCFKFDAYSSSVCSINKPDNIHSANHLAGLFYLLAIIRPYLPERKQQSFFMVSLIYFPCRYLFLLNDKNIEYGNYLPTRSVLAKFQRAMIQNPDENAQIWLHMHRNLSTPAFLSIIF